MKYGARNVDKENYLLNLCVIGSGNELLQLGETSRLGQCVHQFGLDVRLARLLARHLQIANQVLPVV